MVEEGRSQLERKPGNLADVVAALVPAGCHTLIVVDQFEELFTQANELDRLSFIGALLATASAEGDRPVHVVITLRADFYSHCWNHADLLAAIKANQYVVERLGPAQLREVLEKPLVLAAAEFQPGLAEVILEDVGDEPANLPLLEHALLQLWDLSDQRTLTHDHYQAIGRLQGALERHAERVYAGFANPAEQQFARRALAQLVQPGQSSPPKTRAVARPERTSSR